MPSEIFTAPASTEGESPATHGARDPRERLWLFSKGESVSLSSNFHLREFRCRCRSSRCHMILIHPRLVESLQTLRDLLARPLILTSGYRCASYNKIVGGRPRSFHTRGMAADIVCAELDQLKELVQAADQIRDFGGIGEYAGRRFVHLDVRPRGSAGEPERWSG